MRNLSNMKIVVDNGSYWLNNMGDVSMLQVAIKRLKKFFPNSEIQVITELPDKLLTLFPDISPIHNQYPGNYFYPVTRKISRLLVGHKYQFNDHIKQIVNEADIVVSSGGGYIVDPFKNHAVSVVALLGLAAKAGKTTAILGHGFGVTQNKQLRRKLAEFLPDINLIAVRERLVSVPLLQSFGVAENKIVVTGDDAIELAYQHRQAELGNAIGVNVRISHYSDVDYGECIQIKAALAEASQILNAKLIPTPISLVNEESDITTAKALNLDEDGEGLDTPLKVINQVGKCRVVVTGSYHAGVFALSQGIPVIGLANTRYYQEKFIGLADQFGVGCKVIMLSDYPQTLKQEILNSIQDAWKHAENYKVPLLESARQQIEWGYIAYERLANSVSKNSAIAKIAKIS